METDTIFLDLGRLDERLKTSPARLSWHLKMRARGIAFAATNAGIPVTPEEVENWLAGAGLPPRHGEGINDSMSVAAVGYFTLTVLDRASDAPNIQARERMHAMFNRYAAVLDWGSADRIALEPLFEQLIPAFDMLSPIRSLRSVALACEQLLGFVGGYHNDAKQQRDTRIRFGVPPRDLPQAWLASLFVPLLLARAGLLSSSLPSLIPSIRFVNIKAPEIEEALRSRLRREAKHGLRELISLERRLATCVESMRPTRRSKAISAAELLVSFPALKRARLANCLGITPQGAGQLKRRVNAA
jgi:hypothetical protein